MYLDDFILDVETGKQTIKFDLFAEKPHVGSRMIYDKKNHTVLLARGNRFYTLDTRSGLHTCLEQSLYYFDLIDDATLGFVTTGGNGGVGTIDLRTMRRDHVYTGVSLITSLKLEEIMFFIEIFNIIHC